MDSRNDEQAASTHGEADRYQRAQSSAATADEKTPSTNPGRDEAGKLDSGESSLEEVSASEQARKLALAIAAAGLDKKASGIEIIDVAGKVDYAEILVLMTGQNDRHVHAIAKGTQQELKEGLGAVPLSVEGTTAATWVLLDYNDVVVHVFQQEARLFYDLEGLWIDATRIGVPKPGRGRGEASA